MFENLGFSDICLVNIENWDLKKIRDFQTSVFSILTYSEYRKHGCLKISDFFRSKFSIFAIGEYRKHGCLKISDFFRSKFSIFAIGEYRKHGFIKVGEIKSAISEKSAFSTWPIFHCYLSYFHHQIQGMKSFGIVACFVCGKPIKMCIAHVWIITSAEEYLGFPQ